MKIVRNKYIPFGKFDAMNILGFLFVKEDTKLDDELINHEAIHTVQQYEILALSALVALVASNLYASWWYLLIVVVMPIAIYLLAWFIELVLPPYDSAYKDSPFEREAYLNQHDPEYLAKRPLFAWVSHILKNRKTS
jgi:cytochrome c biogenesis protein ResB